MDPAIVEYLEGIRFEKWAHAYFPGIRYDVMTSNDVECFNSKITNARTYPVCSLLEYIRFTLQT